MLWKSTTNCVTTGRWTRSALFALPFNDLLFRAQVVHRAHFDPNQVQVSTLLSIKTGACAEDCAHCSQSAKYDTGLEREKLLPLEEVSRRPRRPGPRVYLFLHGCGLAQPDRQEPGQGHRHDAAGACGLGMRPASPWGCSAGTGAAAGGRRSGLLQPQSGHLARVLRQRDHHAHLPGPAGHPSSRSARRESMCVRVASWDG